MACYQCMFYPCGSGHIAIPQSMPMFLQPVFWDLPVYPMYIFGHTVQEMELTTPRQRGAETKNNSDFAYISNLWKGIRRVLTLLDIQVVFRPLMALHQLLVHPRTKYQWTKERLWSARARVLVHKAGWGSHSLSVFQISPSLLAPIPHRRMTKLLLGHLGRPTCHLTLPPL